MPQFNGFVTTDFQDTIAGTTWRGRDQLGGFLADGLTQVTGETYQSWGIRRKPLLFVAPLDHFGGMADAEKGLPRGKLFVGTGSEGLTYGFYIEKGYTDGRADRPTIEVMNDTWDWPDFIQAIQIPPLNSVIRNLVMNTGYLLGDDRNSVGIYQIGSDGQLHQLESRSLAMTPQIVPWDDAIHRLASDLPGEWTNLYVMQHLSPQQAINRGAAIANDIAQSLQEVLPVFDASRRKPTVVVDPPPPPVGSSTMIERIAQHLQAVSSLHFAPSQLATFITALQTKGFVILSGISGTGKTKLAQEFSRLLQVEDEEPNTLFLSVRPDWRDNKSLLGYYNPLTEQYQTTELLRFILRARQEKKAPSLPSLAQWVQTRLKDKDSQDWLTRFRQLHQHLINKASGDLSPDDLDTLWKQRDNGVTGIGPASSAPLDRSRLSPATEIAMDKSLSPGRRYVDIVKELGGHGTVTQKRHWARAWRAIAALDPEHMHTIVHGSKVAQLLEDLEYDKPADPRNLARRNQIDEIDRANQFLFQKVDELFPHLEMFERSIIPWLMYEYFEEGNVADTTPADVLAPPTDVPASPFFIFFDEMNLARVEYYFAEFLSVLEGGREKDGSTREAIRLHEFEQPINDPEGNLVPSEIHLPPNLYFVGTVNVDETTHMFSPKVLDRAFTLEFSTADLTTYLDSAMQSTEGLSEDERLELRSDFTRSGRFAQIDKSRIQEFHWQHPEYLLQLRDLEARLQPHNLHFGYRIVDEVLMFLANAKQYGWYVNLGEFPAAFDHAVVMKVLPKFHGPRSQLEEPLWSILEWAGLSGSTRQVFNAAMTSNPTQAFTTLIGAADTTHAPVIARKCGRMLYSLYTAGFAAFS